jgi:hypothetical protein
MRDLEDERVHRTGLAATWAGHKVQRRAGDTTWADVRHPTRWPVVFRRRAVGVVHRSGADVRFGSSARAHTGHAGRRCRMGGASGRRDVQVDCRAGCCQGGLKRPTINGGLKVRVMVVVSFLVVEKKRGGDDSLATQDREPRRGWTSDRAAQAYGWACTPRWQRHADWFG